MYATTQGEIVNLYRAECDFMVKEQIIQAKFEQKIDQMYEKDIIPGIVRMSQVPPSRYITTEQVNEIEAEFAVWDAQVPIISSLIEHLDNIEFIEFDEITEDLPLDISVEMQRIQLTRVPLKLTLTKVVEKEIEAPVQLLWLLKIDGLLDEAISNTYYSPFRPAPILQNFKMEFNILKIDSF